MIAGTGGRITSAHQLDSSSSWCTSYVFITRLSNNTAARCTCVFSSSLHISQSSSWTSSTRVCVFVCAFPLESFQVPRCHPADQTSRRKARCFSAPSAAAAASLLQAGAKDAEREDLGRTDRCGRVFIRLRLTVIIKISEYKPDWFEDSAEHVSILSSLLACSLGRRTFCHLPQRLGRIENTQLTHTHVFARGARG